MLSFWSTKGDKRHAKPLGGEGPRWLASGPPALPPLLRLRATPRFANGCRRAKTCRRMFLWASKQTAMKILAKNTHTHIRDATAAAFTWFAWLFHRLTLCLAGCHSPAKDPVPPLGTSHFMCTTYSTKGLYQNRDPCKTEGACLKDFNMDFGSLLVYLRKRRKRGSLKTGTFQTDRFWGTPPLRVHPGSGSEHQPAPSARAAH